MYYTILATVVKTLKDKSTVTTQVPTFYLPVKILGITSESHAKKIANDIINPTKDPSISIDADAIFLED